MKQNCNSLPSTTDRAIRGTGATGTDKQIDASNMFISHSFQKDRATFYIPAYLRVKLKNITELSHQSLQGSVNMIIILDIKTTGLGQEIVEYLKRNLIMRFNKDDAILMNPKINYEVKMKSQQNTICFIVRKILKVNMKNSSELTPLEMIELIVSISLPAIVIEKEDFDQFRRQNPENQKIMKNPVRYHNLQVLTLRFNLMDVKNVNDLSGSTQNEENDFVQFSFTSETNFGEYIFNHLSRQIIFSNISIIANFQQQKNRQSRLKDAIDQPGGKQNDCKEYCHAHILIPLDRDLTVAALTLIIPLIVLGCFNAVIFLQGQYLPERFGNWITLMIAFVAFIPVIRGRIPPNPTGTFMEFLLLLHIIVTTLGFIDGVFFKIYGEKNHVRQISFVILSGLPVLADFVFLIFLLIRSCQKKKKIDNPKQHNETKQILWQNLENIACIKQFSKKKNDYFTYKAWKKQYERWWQSVRCSRRTFNNKVQMKDEKGQAIKIAYTDHKQLPKYLDKENQYISQDGEILGNNP